MGYRVRLGQIPKEVKEKVVGKTYKEVVEIFGTTAIYRELEGYEQLYEIGKYVDYSEGREPFFDFDVYEEVESEFDILTKEGLAIIIDKYRIGIADYYKEMHEKMLSLTPAVIREVQNHFRSYTQEWDDSYDIKPYYLDEEKSDGEISSSWKSEYAIFNLVYIYRTFDWDKNYLIYSGW